MQSFKNYLIEYLTDVQRKKYANVKMTDKARSDTDHFFGKDNDSIHGTLNQDDTHHTKSEVHKKVENHLGHEIASEDYHKGKIKDKYGREVNLGKNIKDEKLRNEFASDSTRDGAKKNISTYRTSTHRGTEVAGQTNKKHSWADHSCKNIVNGAFKNELEPEIRHGTVVHFVHDHDGHEVYRATMQPHHNDKGNVAYVVDSEYGIKHPAFTKSAHETASKLSGEFKPGIFKKDERVYDNSGKEQTLHPNANSEYISKALDDNSSEVRRHAIQHPKATPENISKALNDKNVNVRTSAIAHPKATAEHISKALNDESVHVRYAAIQHPNATSEHINKALNDESPDVRISAVQHPNATSEHINKALDDKYDYVRGEAIHHRNATPEHINKALNDESSYVREAAIQHPKATQEHISKALDDKDRDVRTAAIRHPKATSEHISKALDDKENYVRAAAIQHPKATSEHISKALNDESPDVRRAAIRHPKATSEHISKALNDKNVNVRRHAIQHPKATSEHISKALNDKDDYIRRAAIQHRKATSEHISKALNDENRDVRFVGSLKNDQLNSTAKQIK